MISASDELKRWPLWMQQLVKYGEFRRDEPVITTFISCPFCDEKDFDAHGLKMHLENGWCETYDALEMSAPGVREVTPVDTNSPKKN